LEKYSDGLRLLEYLSQIFLCGNDERVWGLEGEKKVRRKRVWQRWVSLQMREREREREGEI
jgi:hypothetical protein